MNKYEEGFFYEMLGQLHARLLSAGFERACANIPFIGIVGGYTWVIQTLGGHTESVNLKPAHPIRAYYYIMMCNVLHGAAMVRNNNPLPHVIYYDIYTTTKAMFVVYSEF
jgi:hypothetical protein